MAIIILGQSTCALCGKLLQIGEEITGLPATSYTENSLYPYFDQGFHLSCFDNWDKKQEALDLVRQEKKQFLESDYYKEMEAKYGRPKWVDELEN